MLKQTLLLLFLFSFSIVEAQWDGAVEHATTAKHQWSIGLSGLRSNNAFSIVQPGFFTSSSGNREIGLKLAYQYNFKPTLGIKTGLSLNWRVHRTFFSGNKELNPIDEEEWMFRFSRSHSHAPSVQIPLLLTGRSENPILGKRTFLNWEAGMQLNLGSSLYYPRNIDLDVNGESLHFLKFKNDVNPNAALSLNAALGLDHVLKNGDILSLKWRSTYRLNADPERLDVTFLPDHNNVSTSLEMPRFSTGLEVGYTVSLGKKKKKSYKDYKVEKYKRRFP